MPDAVPEIIAWRYFKGDKFNRIHGSQIQFGARVGIIRYFARRRVMVYWAGKKIMTMLWCLAKEPVEIEEKELPE